MSSGGILPPGIRVGVGLGEDERPVVRIGLTVPAGSVGRGWPSGDPAAPVDVAVVITPAQARALGVRLIEQAELVETAERARGPLLRVLP